MVRSRLDYLAAAPICVVLFGLSAWLLPPRSGPMALVLVLEEQLFALTFVALSPFAVLAWLRARAWALPISLVVLFLVGASFLGSDWISLPNDSRARRHDLSVMSWNLQYGSRTPAEARAQLEAASVDLVALQELEPDSADAIESDPTIRSRFPYRTMAPRWGPGGLAILSRYPTERIESLDSPARLQLVVETPRGPVRIVNAHPKRPKISTITPLRLPIDLDPSVRDSEIAAVERWVVASLAGRERLLVLGDFNTSPTEREYGTLTAGLRDTHREVGEGPGWTWRPSRLAFLPVAFLRIDLQLTAGSIYPASSGVDCSFQGDHCRVFGAYEID